MTKIADFNVTSGSDILRFKFRVFENFAFSGIPKIKITIKIINIITLKKYITSLNIEYT